MTAHTRRGVATIHFARLALLVRFACASQVYAQSSKGSIDWILNAFYAERTFPDESLYVTKDVAWRTAGDQTVGALTTGAAQVRSRILRRDDTTVITATAIRDTSGVRDWYTFFQHREGKWKIAAIRTFLLPPAFYAALDSLQREAMLSDTAAADRERMHLSTRAIG